MLQVSTSFYISCFGPIICLLVEICIQCELVDDFALLLSEPENEMQMSEKDNFTVSFCNFFWEACLCICKFQYAF